MEVHVRVGVWLEDGVALGLWVTHKVVGPIDRIQAGLDQIGQGTYVIPLKLRKGDVLADLCESINRMAEKVGRHR